jgi:hypothetical protein
VPPEFWHHSLWAFEMLVTLPFRWISLAVLVSLILTAMEAFPRSSELSHPKGFYLLPVALLAAFPLTIAIGVFFAAPSPSSPNKVGSLLLNGLELVALLFGIYCVYRAKGLRGFTAALVVAELWILFAAGFIAGMSVTGDWL